MFAFGFGCVAFLLFRVFVCACVCVCVRACVRACMRARVCVCVCAVAPAARLVADSCVEELGDVPVLCGMSTVAVLEMQSSMALERVRLGDKIGR